MPIASSQARAPQAAEDLLRAAQFPAEVQRTLKAQFERSAQFFSAGWHGPLDIQTLEGLQGRFLWPEQLFDIRLISFTFDSDKIGFEGDYQLTGGLNVIEQGRFHSVPNNPAVGFAAITLVPQQGAPRTFQVAGMFTDPESTIYVLLLNRLGPDGPVQPPLSAVRIG